MAIMKLPKINSTIDEQNVLIKSQKTAMIVIRVLLAWSAIVIGCEIYLLMKI